MNKSLELRAKIRKFWRTLGPGLITGASDDDPSGIATYSQSGAQFGTALLWTALVTYPLMVSIQEMCARIGLVTDHGLTGVIKRHYSKRILYLILLVSFPSIVLNIGADIAGMGAVGQMLVPQIPAVVFSILFTGLLMYGIVVWSYRRISTILKWLCIVLFSYLIIPFLTHTDWLLVAKETVFPKFELTAEYFTALVGILGTTISPYLFFWQTSMEVEEVNQRHLVVDKRMINLMQKDVEGGMFVTNIVFFFIILTTGTVLFNAGIRDVQTVEQAAAALQPLAGRMAYALFAVGVLGTGFLAVPVLAGALSYMMAEIFDWQEGLDKKFHEAKGFYITIIVSLILGLAIDFVGISPIKALIYTAVLYGVTAPVLIALILHICNNKKIMKEYVNGFWSNLLGGLTFLLMSAAAVLLVWFQFKG
ncbi:MAG: divalent metal cation transporter [Acidobacteria bacterium]|nr:divalent metal cation transporter [Acidobacteriota bacterium]